jgi:hypothetical protein
VGRLTNHEVYLFLSICELLEFVSLSAVVFVPRIVPKKHVFSTTELIPTAVLITL